MYYVSIVLFIASAYGWRAPTYVVIFNSIWTLAIYCTDADKVIPIVVGIFYEYILYNGYKNYCQAFLFSNETFFFFLSGSTFYFCSSESS